MTFKELPERRPHDWQQRLSHALGEWTAKNFVWGERDCACFVADVVGKMLDLDYDLMADLRGHYTDADEAKVALDAEGHNSLYHRITKQFGRPYKPCFAAPGDIALDHGPNHKQDGPCLGIVNGSNTAFLGEIWLNERANENERVDAGLIFIPTKSVRMIFKV